MQTAAAGHSQYILVCGVVYIMYIVCCFLTGMGEPHMLPHMRAQHAMMPPAPGLPHPAMHPASYPPAGYAPSPSVGGAPPMGPPYSAPGNEYLANPGTHPMAPRNPAPMMMAQQGGPYMGNPAGAPYM